MGNGSGWILYFVAGILALYGMALQWWGIFADRRFDRRRCPKCWYDMTGTKGRRCPECGREFKGEPQLHRRRPRIGSILIGLAMLVVSAVLFQAGRDGIPAMLPDSVLVFLAPSYAGEGGDLEAELTRRIRADALDDDDWHRLIDRLWEESKPLWTIELASRKSWPINHPVHVAFYLDRRTTGWQWLDDCRERIRIIPKFGGAGEQLFPEAAAAIGSSLESMIGRSIDRTPREEDDWKRWAIDVGVPPTDATTFEFEVVVELRTFTPGRGQRGSSIYRPVRSETVRLPVSLLRNDEEVLPPLEAPDGHGAEAYLGLRIDVGAGRHRQRARSRDVADEGLRVTRDCAGAVRPVDGLLVALRIDLRLDGETVASGPLAWQDSATLGSVRTVVPLEWRTAPADLQAIPEEQQARWTVHATADPEGAMRFFEGTEYLLVPEPFEVPIDW